jgi:16S rRNA G1207 methylase RsmC
VKFLEYCLAVSDNHYFDANPQTPSKERSIEVQLAERTVKVVTDTGVFSSAGIDKGTQILLKHSPLSPREGKVVDLGAGWGSISIELALANPELNVLAVEVNSRALELIEKNKKSLNIANIQTIALEEVPDDSVDQIWSNPPIRIGKVALHKLLREAIRKLKPGGEAFLVVQKHLGSDSLAKWLEQDQGHQVQRIDNSKGFRVFRVTKY